MTSAARFVLLASLVAALGGAARGQPSTPAAGAQDPSKQEAALRDELRRGLSSADVAARAAAVDAYGEGTRSLGVGDVAASRLVASTLGSVLDDDELPVRAAALGQLAWGRDPATVIALLEEQLGELRNEIEKHWTRPDEASRAHRAEATTLYARACETLGRHADDRAVEVLEGEVRALRRLAGPSNAAEALVRPLSEGLLALGSRPAVEAVVKTAGVYSGSVFTRNAGQIAARRIHDALAAFAERIGRAPPVFDERYDQAWREWFSGVEKTLPASLGRRKEPLGPPEPEMRRKDPRPARPGVPERP